MKFSLKILFEIKYHDISNESIVSNNSKSKVHKQLVPSETRMFDFNYQTWLKQGVFVVFSQLGNSCQFAR